MWPALGLHSALAGHETGFTLLKACARNFGFSTVLSWLCW